MVDRIRQLLECHRCGRTGYQGFRNTPYGVECVSVRECFKRKNRKSVEKESKDA